MDKFKLQNKCGFVVFQSKKNNEYYFHLKAGNGEIILQSEGYKQKASCENGIASVKENSQIPERFDRKVAVNDEFYFVLKAGNGEPIGHSETYETKQGMENGIESVMENAPNAKICYEGDEFDTTIIVNGSPKIWNDKDILFQEVVRLAFGSYIENDRTCYTATYARGRSKKPQGSMVKGDVVKVKHKMVFNVTATDKS
jgi:uncharacterized protein YegP (UPF0339 family)